MRQSFAQSRSLQKSKYVSVYGQNLVFLKPWHHVKGKYSVFEVGCRCGGPLGFVLLCQMGKRPQGSASKPNPLCGIERCSSPCSHWCLMAERDNDKPQLDAACGYQKSELVSASAAADVSRRPIVYKSETLLIWWA